MVDLTETVAQECMRPIRAWVVFSGQADLFYLRVLRCGFRHCWILIHDGRTWLSIDPMAHCMEVAGHYHIADDFDMPGWLAARGDCLIECRVARRRIAAPLGLMTCVEVCKRFLGIHARRIQTPYQLYRHLQKLQQTREGIKS